MISSMLARFFGSGSRMRRSSGRASRGSMFWIVGGNTKDAYPFPFVEEWECECEVVEECVEEGREAVDEVVLDVVEVVDFAEDDEVAAEAAEFKGLNGAAAHACEYAAKSGSLCCATRQGSSWNSRQ